MPERTEREPDYRGPESHTGVAPRRSWDPGRAAPPCPCQGHYKWDPSHRLQPTSPGKRERCEGRAAQRREQALGRAPIPTGTKAPGRPRAPRAQGLPPSPGGARDTRRRRPPGGHAGTTRTRSASRSGDARRQEPRAGPSRPRRAGTLGSINSFRPLGRHRAEGRFGPRGPGWPRGCSKPLPGRASVRFRPGRGVHWGPGGDAVLRLAGRASERRGAEGGGLQVSRW